MIAVHPVVAATHAADRRAALRRRHQLLEVAESGARHRVAAVEHDLDRDTRHLLTLREVEQREQMGVDRVHATLADQTDEMQGAPAGLHPAAHVDEDRVLEEAAVLDRVVDAHEILLHHAAGTEVEMTDLAVSHLSAR